MLAVSFRGVLYTGDLTPLTELRLFLVKSAEFVRADGKGPHRGLDE